MMLRVRLFGAFALESRGVALSLPERRRACALLGWLALHPGMHPRSEVAGRFWPDVLDSSARKSLRTELVAVRHALGAAGTGALVATREMIGLVGDGVFVDAREFERLVRDGGWKTPSICATVSYCRDSTRSGSTRPASRIATASVTCSSAWPRTPRQPAR